MARLATVRFAPREGQKAQPPTTRSVLGGLAVLAALWPLLLPLYLLLVGEWACSRIAGVWVGFLQGNAYAAAAMAEVLLSREGGVRSLLYGRRRPALGRAVPAPMPGTPPSGPDAATTGGEWAQGRARVLACMIKCREQRAVCALA